MTTARTILSQTLRKSKVVAAKLDLTDFREWIECELNWYTGTTEIPEYRKVHARVKALNPYHWWISIVIENRKMEHIVSSRDTGQAICSIEDVKRRSKAGVCYLVFPIPGAAQQAIARMNWLNMEFQLHFDASSTSGILDAVRNRVLDWSISLETAGVTGEGMTFSGKEREAAKAMA